MRIVVDINHPAHVHYFRNFIREMKKRDHDVIITATEKDVALKLLDNYKLKYINLGKYGNNLMEKLLNIIFIDIKMYRMVKKYNPDVFIGFGSLRAPHVAFLMRKKSINFEDTENSMEQIRLYLPFVNYVCTPQCFKVDLGKKQIKYDGYIELAHLHPNYFKPDQSVLNDMGLNVEDPFVVLRFVSWKASHDIGNKGLSYEAKKQIVRELEKYARVFISSEGELEECFKKYQITLPPEKLHDLLYYARLYIGEGATTASECAILGTPAIYVNTIRLGYTDEEECRYNLVYNISKRETMDVETLELAKKLLENKNLKNDAELNRQKLLKDKIDVTSFMVNIVEYIMSS